MGQWNTAERIALFQQFLSRNSRVAYATKWKIERGRKVEERNGHFLAKKIFPILTENNSWEEEGF